MKTKICRKCKEEKPVNNFCNNIQSEDGLQFYCKKCHNLVMKEQRQNNKLRIRESLTEKKCCKCDFTKSIALFQKSSCNKDGYQQRCKECQNKESKKSKLKNHEKVLEYNKNYRKLHKEESRAYRINKKKTDVQYRLAGNCRRRVVSGLKYQQKIKLANTIELIGCSWEFLRKHLESKFTEGMSWDNYGKWHIDHIIPISSFDLSNIEQQKIACNYTNLQPLWALDNIRKGNR